MCLMPLQYQTRVLPFDPAAVPRSIIYLLGLLLLESDVLLENNLVARLHIKWKSCAWVGQASRFRRLDH